MMSIKKTAGFLALLAVCMLCSLTATAEADGVRYPWVYEAFEDMTAGSVTAQGAILSVTEDGFGESKGALKITLSGNITNGSGGYKTAVRLESGKTYKLSFYSKLSDGANIPRDGSKNGDYNADGEISKVYAVFQSGGSKAGGNFSVSACADAGSLQRAADQRISKYRKQDPLYQK